MKCIKCGKYPFCNKIENSQQEACKNFIKRIKDKNYKRGRGKK